MVPTLSSSASSLHNYLNYVSNIPILSEHEELELIEKTQQLNCIKSAQKLVLHNLRFVVFIAKKYEHYGLPLQDLIQEGNIALMLAIKRYKIELASKSRRLVGFAATSIASAMWDYINRNLKMFKLATTKGVRKILNHIGKYQFNHNGLTLTKQSVQQICSDLNVSESDVLDANERYRSSSVSIENSQKIDDDNDFMMDIVDTRYSPETLVEQFELESHHIDRLHAAINKLNDRQKFIVQHRWLTENKMTRAEIGKLWGISQQAIESQEKNILNILKLEMNVDN